MTHLTPRQPQEATHPPYKTPTPPALLLPGGLSQLSCFQISLTYIFLYIMLCLRPSFLSHSFEVHHFFLFFLIMKCINISQGSIFFFSLQLNLSIYFIHDLKYGLLVKAFAILISNPLLLCSNYLEAQ